MKSNIQIDFYESLRNMGNKSDVFSIRTDLKSEALLADILQQLKNPS